MNSLHIEIQDKLGKVLAAEEGKDNVVLVYDTEYLDGDTIHLMAPSGSFLVIQLDDVLEPAYVYSKESEYTFVIPFGEKRYSYNPKCFVGSIHVLKARFATQAEMTMHKNLAYNSHDTAYNTACYPHASANIETRGESVFAARNAIDGNIANKSHGNWPYESWGINQDPQAEFYLDFGRAVCIDTLVLVTRADFPHDNYWKLAEVVFSTGETMTLTMQKSTLPHSWHFEPKKVTGLTLRHLVKDETDPSPFPALTQIAVYGTDILL
ncbi:MAG: carbohydrate-binding protein [Treponema sp.]|nr:carbohydrate-binding protein [Treponema sp.]